MTSKRYQLENYRKYLLNRVTASPHFMEYIENCLATEDDAAQHSFHKIMVHNWMGNDRSLFEALADYFSPSFIPVNYTSVGAVSSFYTSSLTLVLRMSKLDFMFPHQRTMYNVDILFNDKTSAECFENRITIEDIVAGVVSNRFSDRCELNLSDFCNDSEFQERKINFYKIQLLSHFKILMLRMGRDTKCLNLSNNNLSQVPVDILNFFIKGDLIAINFSNNEIPSVQELQRVSSKIEKLWLEGNPLCEDLDPLMYVKDMTKKFPRLNELDGVKLNELGVVLPFRRNFLVTPNKKTEMLVEKFLCLYFANYDLYPRKRMRPFYAYDAKITIQTRFGDDQIKLDSALEKYTNNSRNMLSKKHHEKLILGGQLTTGGGHRLHRQSQTIEYILQHMPPTEHDPATFTVDVVRHDKRCIIIIVDGVFREICESKANPCKYFHFRRTFVFNINSKVPTRTEYEIQHEMFTISFATQEMIENSFKNIPGTTNQLALHNPEPEDIEALRNIFCHITGLKPSEAEQRLKDKKYDVLKAMKVFRKDLREEKVSAEQFAPENGQASDDEFSDEGGILNEID